MDCKQEPLEDRSLGFMHNDDYTDGDHTDSDEDFFYDAVCEDEENLEEEEHPRNDAKEEKAEFNSIASIPRRKVRCGRRLARRAAEKAALAQQEMAAAAVAAKADAIVEPSADEEPPANAPAPSAAVPPIEPRAIELDGLQDKKANMGGRAAQAEPFSQRVRSARQFWQRIAAC